MDSMKNTTMSTCAECDKPLTAEEQYFYEDRCEQCERAWVHRINSWRMGHPDTEFDELFGSPILGRH